jgi:hypothetical protein
MNKSFFLILLSIFNALHAEQFWFDVLPLAQVLNLHPEIQYQKLLDPYFFNYKPFPFTIDPALHPNQGSFDEMYVLKIPQGWVTSYGQVFVQNQFIQQLIWKGWTHNIAVIPKIQPDEIFYVPKRIAVIGQAAFHIYWHWTTEVLARLALLEMSGIEYDYVHMPQGWRFMHETLQLWGFDFKKMIIAREELSVKAQELIVPSLPSNTNFGGVFGACYVQPALLDYVKNKLLNAAMQHKPSVQLSPRIFISRKDAPQRRIINEEAVFKLLEEKGFVRYELSKLSVVDQIWLFHHAQIIVSPQGSCLANTIYCKPGTKVIELLQGLNDCTFWYLSQDLNLDYTAIKTTEFKSNHGDAWASNTYMPLRIIREVIKQHGL